MRILYFSQYFPPEVGATQTRAHEMATFLASQGHKVTMVTEVPNHPSGIIPESYRGRLSERRLEGGIDVLRLWVWAGPEKTFKARMRFYLSYAAIAAIAGSLLRGKYDLVYATSPPLFVGLAGLLVAALRRIPFVFEVRDLWPESAVALGEVSNRQAIRVAQLLERLLYRRARRIVVVTQGIYDRLAHRGIPASKLALIPNGANTDRFRYDGEGGRGVRARLGLGDSFVAMYAGVHGIAQGLDTLVEAAHLLREHEDIAFVFVGEGPSKRAAAQAAQRLGLENARFLPEVPSNEMASYLSAASCAIVPLKDEPIFRGALPSKMFEAWACSRPVVLSVAGEAEEVLRQAGGGIAVKPASAEELAGALLYLKAHSREAETMGQGGRAYVAAHYSRREQARKLEKTLIGAMGNRATWNLVF